MLEKLFRGIVTELVKPNTFTKQMFALQEFKAAIERAKIAKAADETGLAAELLEHMPNDLCNDLLNLTSQNVVKKHRNLERQGTSDQLRHESY